MSIQEELDGSNLFHLLMIYLIIDLNVLLIRDVLFDKKHDFLSFLFKMLLFLMKLTHSQVLIKNRMHEARIKRFCCCCLKAEAVLSFDIFRYSNNKIFWGPWPFCENYQKCIFFFTLAGKEFKKWLTHSCRCIWRKYFNIKEIACTLQL